MEKRGKISASTLKFIALVTMSIDHIGAVIVQRAMLLPGFDHGFWSAWYWPIRYIGRLAFPIFCFLLVEGFVHTSDVRKYLGRLLLFALLSELPFNLAITGEVFSTDSQNVFWELALGILAMLCMKNLEERKNTALLLVFLRLLVIVFFAGAAEILHLDYGMYGIISIVALYVFRHSRGMQLLVGAISFCWEPVAPFAFLFISLYNGKRGRNLKYVFYAFYPIHLLIFYLIARGMGCQY